MGRRNEYRSATFLMKMMAFTTTKSWMLAALFLLNLRVFAWVVRPNTAALSLRNNKLQRSFCSSSAVVTPPSQYTAQHLLQQQRSGVVTVAAAAAAGSGGGLAEELTLDGVEIRGPIAAVQNFLIVKLKDTLMATGGGILLPDQSKEKPTEGLVVVSGPGRIHPHTGIRIENPIRPGMSVLFGKFDGTPIEYKGDDCQVVRDDNVLLAYEGVTMRLDNVQCIRDYVLIELPRNEGNVQTSSGVVIAAQVLADAVPCTGRVVRVGPGRATATGEFSPSPVQPGDYVKFKDYAGNEVIIEGKPYSAVKMVDILCTLREDNGETNEE